MSTSAFYFALAVANECHAINYSITTSMLQNILFIGQGIYYVLNYKKLFQDSIMLFGDQACIRIVADKFSVFDNKEIPFIHQLCIPKGHHASEANSLEVPYELYSSNFASTFVPVIDVLNHDEKIFIQDLCHDLAGYSAEELKTMVNFIQTQMIEGEQPLACLNEEWYYQHFSHFTLAHSHRDKHTTKVVHPYLFRCLKYSNKINLFSWMATQLRHSFS